ncbi:MAG: YggS family pyridoxal phosphate-dependent enzyme [Clostridia bacterium]|nr:YggS family pyridoxal phosphate-dependent enzyme [Clostridia bacterium]
MSFEYIDKNTEKIRENIRLSERLAGRNEGETQMIAAVKYAEAEEIAYLVDALGVRDLGENRVQQLLAHYEALGEREDVRWHFIGTLQTNKVKYIVDKVAMIHSVDSLKLAAEIDRQAKKKGIVMDVLVEINGGAEAAKSGVLPEEAEALCRGIMEMTSLRLCGFMTMGPKFEKKEEYLKYFEETSRQVLDIWTKKLHNIGRPILSMGMSESYQAAIEAGADFVRVGRGLFVKD